MIIKQISVFVENKMGRMTEITQVIADAGVDIRALSIADTSDFGILRLIVNNPDAAVAALRNAGMTVSLTDVIAVGVEDKPGAFAKAMRAMSEAELSIEYMYAFISRSDNRAFVILRVEEPDRAINALQKEGFEILGSEQIYNL